MKTATFLIAVALSQAAMAASQVSIDSKVFVERSVKGSDGKLHVVRAAPKPVFPGDPLLFQLTYRNTGAKPATDFKVTNPIPPSVVFASSDPGAEYSVDGGKSWGQLADLRVKTTGGSLRTAVPADVTAVRWVMPRAIPVGGSGTLSFHAFVK